MRLLAAWFGNPGEHWINILVLKAVVAVGVWALRKFQAKRR